MQEYIYIFILMLAAMFLSLLIFFLSYISIVKNYNWEKVSSYECGFQPFEDSRNKFDVKFYLVAILFIIFDIEISFLFPWALTVYNIGFFSFISMSIFLIVLTIGFIYEWKKVL